MSRHFLSQFYIARLLIQVCKDGRAETDVGYIFFGCFFISVRSCIFGKNVLLLPPLNFLWARYL